MPEALDNNPNPATFFDGIDTTITGIATLSSAPPYALTEGLHRLSEQIASATRSLNPQDPAALAPPLVAAQHALGALLDELEKSHFAGRADVLHELRIKQVQLNDAITCALGLSFQAVATSPSPNIVRDTAVPVSTTLTARAAEPVGLFAESLEIIDSAQAERLLAVDTEPLLTAARPFSQQLEAASKLTHEVTRPYFFRKDIQQPTYTLRAPSLRDAPATPPALTAWATLRYHETEVRVGHVVTVGDQFVSFIPEATIAISTHAEVLPNKMPAALISTSLHSTESPLPATNLVVPSGWSVSKQTTLQDKPGESSFLVSGPATNRHTITVEVTARLHDGSIVTENLRPVGYGNLPRTNFFTQSTDRIVPVDLALPTRRRIAYLPGTGDPVPEALASINLPVTTLTVADLTPAKLAQFDTVLLGVRTYNAHPDLHGAPTTALLDFARAGGNVVVQYQTGEFTGADAPYPLNLGVAEKVVDETAPVRLLDPQVPLLSTPNRITAADFNDWIEERGHGFLGSWDPRYTALTETHDPGGPETQPQAPQRGGLLTTPLGRGRWTYCAFALYRQLPEAVPGAFRLFVNLLDVR